jgi:hypothetical protein
MNAIEIINQGIRDKLNDLLTSGKNLSFDLELDIGWGVVNISGYAEHFLDKVEDEWFFDFTCTSYTVTHIREGIVVETNMPTILLTQKI